MQAQMQAEPLPPGKDSICSDKLLNKQELVDKRYADTEEIKTEQLRFSKISMGRASPSKSSSRAPSNLDLRDPVPSVVDRSEFNPSKTTSTADGKKKKRGSRLSESEQRRRKEKKMLDFYQSQVRPVIPWSPVLEKEYMIDGTDVDLLIKKKRAHKTLLAEVFHVENLTKINKKKTMKKPSRQVSASNT